MLADRINKLVDGIATDLQIEQLRLSFTASGKTVRDIKGKSDATTGTVEVPRHFLTLVEDREDGSGRSAGRFAPPDAILAWIKRKGITPNDPKTTLKQLAFMINRKLAWTGNDVFSGRREGIKINPVFDKNIDEFIKGIEDDFIESILLEFQKFNDKQK